MSQHDPSGSHTPLHHVDDCESLQTNAGEGDGHQHGHIQAADQGARFARCASNKELSMVVTSCSCCYIMCESPMQLTVASCTKEEVSRYLDQAASQQASAEAPAPAVQPHMPPSAATAGIKRSHNSLQQGQGTEHTAIPLSALKRVEVRWFKGSLQVCQANAWHLLYPSVHPFRSNSNLTCVQPLLQAVIPVAAVEWECLQHTF